MTDKLHSEFTVADGIHIIHSWSVTDPVALEELAVAASDVGRVAYVEGEGSFHVLIAAQIDDGEGGQRNLWAPVAAYDDRYPSPVGENSSPGVYSAYARLDHVHDASSKADALLTLEAVSAATLFLQAWQQAVKLTHAAGCVVTLSNGLPIGFVGALYVMPGAGQASIVGTGGMVVYPPKGLSTKSRPGATGIARLTVEILSATEACLSGDVA